MKITVFSVALLIALLSQPCMAGYIFEKQVDPGRLQQELQEAGFQVQAIVCSGIRCEILWKGKETKDPRPVVNAHVFTDPFEAAKARRNRMRALAKKWKDGTITNSEKDDLLKEFVSSQLGE